MLSSEDGVVGFHIIGSLIAYGILVFILFKLIGLFLLMNSNEDRRPLIREQLKYLTENFISSILVALFLGAILFFVIAVALFVISHTLFDINSIIYGVLDKKFFILALLMASVNSVLIFFLFFEPQGHYKLQGFLDLSSTTIKSVNPIQRQKTKKTTIRVKGQQFASVAAACKAFNVSASTVRSRMRSKDISCSKAINEILKGK